MISVVWLWVHQTIWLQVFWGFSRFSLPSHYRSTALQVHTATHSLTRFWRVELGSSRVSSKPSTHGVISPSIAVFLNHCMSRAFDFVFAQECCWLGGWWQGIPKEGRRGGSTQKPFLGNIIINFIWNKGIDRYFMSLFYLNIWDLRNLFRWYCLLGKEIL